MSNRYRIRNIIETILLVIVEILIFYIIPKNIGKYVMIVPSFSLLSILSYLFKMKKLALSIIISVLFTIPCFPIQEADTAVSYRALYFIYVAIIACSIIDIVRYKEYSQIIIKKTKGIVILSLILLIIELIYYIVTLNNEITVIKRFFFVILQMIPFFYFAYNSKLDISDYIQILIISFIGVAVYTCLQTFYQYQPYTVTSRDVILDDTDFAQIRSSALFGHPLVLSAVDCYLCALILIHYILRRKISIIGVLLVILVSILTISRTPIIINLFLFFVFILKSGILKNRRKMAIVLMFVTSLSFVAVFFLSSFLDSFYLRFTQDHDTTHRFAGYQTGINVFSNNLFGVGADNLMLKIRKGHFNAPGFWAYFTTMDSFYMSILSAYGVLASIHYFFYYYYFFFAFKHRSAMKGVFISMLLLYIVFTLVGLSFDIQIYPVLIILTSLSSGFILKNYRKKGILNN